jgi:hypothetical protein
MKKVDESLSISERIKDNELLLQAMDEAVHEALRMHKLLGHPIAVWEDGKVKIIPADQIPLNGEANGDEKAAHS